MNDRESRSALSSLSGPLAVPDSAALERQHQKIRPHLRQFVRGIPERRRRKAWHRRIAVAGSFVLCAALFFGLWLRPSADVQPFAVEQGRSVSGNDERHGFTTGERAPAQLRTRRGVEVRLAADSRVASVASDESRERLELVRGSVRVRVPKLTAGRSFSVQTPDATVTVHGTVFSVSVSGEGSTSSTCVEVSEGLVSVARAGKVAWLAAGQKLNCSERASGVPLTTATPPSAAEAPATPSSAPEVASVRQPRAAGVPVSPPAPGIHAADETLAAQNALLAFALQAERTGRYGEARSKLEELLARYPRSALRPDAERSLERIKRKQP